LNQEAIDIHGSDILECDKIQNENRVSSEKYSYVRAKCILHEHTNKKIVQQFLTQVPLFENRKFDLRTFVIIKFIDNEYQVKFNKGFLRTCIDQFTDVNQNIFAHYCNVTKQKLNKNFDQLSETIYVDNSKLPELK